LKAYIVFLAVMLIAFAAGLAHHVRPTGWSEGGFGF